MFITRAAILSLLLVGSNAFAPSQPLREQSRSSLSSTEVTEVETVDVSIPYDATVQAAYETSDKSMSFEEFKPKYLAQAVAEVVAKRNDVDVDVESVEMEILTETESSETKDEIVYYRREKTLEEKDLYLWLPKSRRK
jgi:hypothetical protein